MAVLFVVFPVLLKENDDKEMAHQRWRLWSTLQPDKAAFPALQSHDATTSQGEKEEMAWKKVNRGSPELTNYFIKLNSQMFLLTVQERPAAWNKDMLPAKVKSLAKAKDFLAFVPVWLDSYHEGNYLQQNFLW